MIAAAGLFAVVCGRDSSEADAAQLGATPPTLAQDVARIDAPTAGAVLTGSVEVRGRAAYSDAARFSFYRILLGRGRDPAQMRPLDSPYDRAVENGHLATWDVSRYPPGEYLLGLAVYDRDGKVAHTSVLVSVAAQPTPTPFAILPTLSAPPPESQPALRPQQSPDPSLSNPGMVDPNSPGLVSPPAPPMALPTRELAPIPTIAPIRGGSPFDAPQLDAAPGDPLQDDPMTTDLPPIR